MSRPPRAALLLAMILALLAFAGSAAADVPSHSFSYTGSSQSWTVPDGVTTITIDAKGASGGNGCWGGTGGAGADITGTLSVTPGEVLDLVVGGSGQGCGSHDGGWGGRLYDGGLGGLSTYSPGSGYEGSGGGAASAISLSGAPLVVAGGGGGSSIYYGNGGDSGSDGTDSCCAGAQGGKAGTASGPGAGGAAGYYGGSAGSDAIGGVGGTGAQADNYGGGGGGGGYHGGGGGGGDANYSAGGGGGADFTAASIGSPAVTDGDHSGAGQIVIYEGVLPPAPPQRQALIDSSTVVGGASSQEAQVAKALGYKVTVVSDAKWGSMTSDDFGKYDLLIAGDPSCGSLPGGLTASAGQYGPVVMGTAGGRTAAGNRVLVGTDPVFHDGGDFTSADARGTIIRTGIAFAGTQTGTTGMYLDASCSGGQSLSILPQLSAGAGDWTVGAPPCGGSVSLIADNPAFADLTTDSLQGWGCSVHETFPTFPSDWSALAVATDGATHPTCGVDPHTGASDCGEAYVLIAGSGIVLKSGSISVTPLDSSDPQGGDHTVSAHVTSGDSPLSGQAVTWTVTGQNAGATGTCVPADCSTDANGDVSFTYHDANGAGDDTIKASFKDARGSLQAATAQEHWTAGPSRKPISAMGTSFDATEGAALSGQKVASFVDSNPSPSADEYTATIDWGDGETSDGTIVDNGGGQFDVVGDHTYADEGTGSYSVAVTINDTTDASDTATVTSTANVADAKPVVTLDSSNDQSVKEGSTHNYSYSVSDDDSDTVTTSCGDHGTKVDGSDTGSSFQCSFPDGPASTDVSVSVTNSDGSTSDPASQTVSIANVAPTVTLSSSNPTSVDESHADRTFSYTISDPGQDTVQSVATSCGGNGQKTGESNTDSSGSFTCVFAHGPASSTVSVQATDSDGDAGNTDTQSVTVNDPPIKATGSPVSGVETKAFSDQKVASFTDPTGYATADEYSASISWGDGSSSTGTITKTGDGAFDVTGSHTYGEEGSYTVTVTVTDTDNAANSDTAASTATIGDAPIHASGVSAITTSQAYSGPVATFTDEANGPTSDFSATIDWGDGSSSAGTIGAADANGKRTVSGSHTYTITGPVTITVTVTDDGGSTDTAKTSALVYAFATANGGSFAISDKQAASNGTVTYWGAQWEKANPFLSGSTGSASFKGFIEAPASKTAPKCGTTWTSSPGNSSVPPTSVPAYMAVVVASKESKSGSTISGDVKRIVVVKTAAGYSNDPGHAGTGTIVGSVCG